MKDGVKAQSRLRSLAWSAAVRLGRGVLRRAKALWNLAPLPWRGLARAVPVTAWLALALVSFAWWFEHDARVRQASDLRQLKKQTAADVAALSDRAKSAVREANAHAQAIHDLEARNRKLDQTAGELQTRLASLQTKESTQVEQVATLSTLEVAQRVAARLGLDAQQFERAIGGTVAAVSPQPAGSAAGSPPPTDRHAIHGTTPSSVQEPANLTGQKAGATKPAVGTPLPQDSTLRKIETSLVELDACREQGAVKDEQVSNCRQQVEGNAGIISQQAASIEKLNDALAAKGQILSRREAEYRAELQAARGTPLGRLARVLKYVGLGVAIGTVIR